MADISTWSPTDNANTAAPPDGWPENQAPSSVNNCARAMMGAIRRWYDTVNSQMGAISASLSNYLLLSGGTMSGTLVAPQVTATNSLTVGGGYAQIDGANISFARTTTVNALSYFNGLANFNQQVNLNAPSYANSDFHVLGGLYTSAGISCGSISCTGNAQVNGTLSCPSISCSNVAASNSVVASGPINAGSFHTTGTLMADSQITGGSFVTAGTIFASSQIQGGSFYTNGTIYAADHIQTNSFLTVAGDVNCHHDVLCDGTVLGAYLHSTGNIRADVGLDVGPSGAYVQINSGGVFANQIYTGGNVTAGAGLSVGPSGAYAQINSTGSYNPSGSWIAFSDEAIKERVTPYSRGLTAITALRPVSFRYRAGTPFADDAGTERVGLLAQDVASVIPEMVGEVTIGEQTLRTLDPGKLVYVLCNALRELAARVEHLEGSTKGVPGHV